jgi:hypothetical protein
MPEPLLLAYHAIGSKRFDPPRWIIVTDGTPEAGGKGIEILAGGRLDTQLFRFGSRSSQLKNQRTVHLLTEVPDHIAAAWMRAKHLGHI